jgi:diaminopimelate epimerase
VNLNFEKWSGAGNDFILIDLRDFEIRKSLSLWKKTQSELAIALCRRTHSLGADGLIFLFETQGQPEDLTWEF